MKSQAQDFGQTHGTGVWNTSASYSLLLQNPSSAELDISTTILVWMVGRDELCMIPLFMYTRYQNVLMTVMTSTTK